MSKKFSDLTQLTTPDVADIFPIDDVSASTTKKITLGDALATPSATIPNSLMSGAGTSWAWQSWTPTLTNITIGNGSIVAKYAQTGKTITARIYFTVGSTTVISGIATFSLPVTAHADYGTSRFVPVGVGNYHDSGATMFPGIAFIDQSTSAVKVAPLLTNSTYGTYEPGGAPVTPAAGDNVNATITYEAA